MAKARVPAQDLHSSFGEPPLRVYNGDLFYIEVLFWLGAQLSIHQHGFAGAFHVLHGASLHCRYDFALKERINSRLFVDRAKRQLAQRPAGGDHRHRRAAAKRRRSSDGNQAAAGRLHRDRPRGESGYRCGSRGNLCA